jgi:hypothetical protein
MANAGQRFDMKNWERGLDPDVVAQLVGKPPPPPPQPDFKYGQRVLWEGGRIMLVDQGVARWIPDPPTYNNLFVDWNGIITPTQNPYVTKIPEGLQVPSGAFLAAQKGDPHVFLIDGGVKRWIVNPDVMAQYYFDWKKIYNVPQNGLNNIQPGPNVVLGDVWVGPPGG